ncbi:uncharacterized protein TM35_000281870 [Trypanosoma theileri]|uniref:Uncharacterized protein n=1 Tax=Trypanosoma theileri TaxID=67003 RepID=A0A1X0NPD7_9TRYP|nr:uncharacterized protein TM35_000281870 [Trypanosoma theileri]ORC86471.1 hypothetical protein TM35_000281870 [Trypanosoma theileri]
MPLTHKPHRRRSGVVQQHNGVLPTHSPHTHNDSLTCSCQRGTTAFTKMYTESHLQRGKEKQKSSKRKEQQQDTNSTQSIHNTIITAATPIREKHSPTPAHQLNPQKKKQTHYVKPKRNSLSPPPRRLQSLKQATHHTPQEQKYVRGNAV